MSRPNSPSSFDEGISADSGIGSSPCPSGSPLDGSELTRCASYSHQNRSGERHLRRIQSECRPTKHFMTETPNKGLPHNGVHFAGQVALSSRPSSTPSLDLDGRSASTRDSSVPTRPQTPYPFRRITDPDDTLDTDNVEKVLTTPVRKTQTLMNAPRLRLDFTKPLVTVSNQSILHSREENGEREETETEQCGIGETKGNIVRAGTPIPSLAPATENGQHHKANGMPPPRTHQVYTVQSPSLPLPEEEPSSPTSQIPSLLRVLDANLHPQPHLLSPLAERDEQSDHTRSRSQLSLVPCTAASTQSPTSSLPSLSRPAPIEDDSNEPERFACSCPDQSHRSRPRTNTQRTRETDPYAFNTTERLGLQEAPLLPARHIERIDLRCGEVTIPHRCGAGGNEGHELARARSGAGRKKRFGVRVRMVWMRIKGLFCQRRAWGRGL